MSNSDSVSGGSDVSEIELGNEHAENQVGSGSDNEDYMHHFGGMAGGDDDEDDDEDASSEASDASVDKMISALSPFFYNAQTEEPIVHIVDNIRGDVRELTKAVKDLTKIMKSHIQSQSTKEVSAPVVEERKERKEHKDSKSHSHEDEPRKEKKERSRREKH